MIDMITAFTQIKDSEDNVVQYDIAYSVENDGTTNQFCIVVKADEMVDSTDITEAKAKANVKASAAKDTWVASLPPLVSVPQDDQVGEVSL